MYVLKPLVNEPLNNVAPMKAIHPQGTLDAGQENGLICRPKGAIAHVSPRPHPMAAAGQARPLLDV